MGEDRRYRWVLVVLLGCMGGLNYGDRSAIASVFPLIRSEFGMTDLGLAAIGSCFLWAYAPFSPVAGMLADRFSRSRMIVWCLAGWSFVTFLTGFVANTPQLLATRVALGLLEAAFVPAAVALIAEYHPSRTLATAIGLFTGGSALGVVIGGTGLGYLGDHFGWRFGFFALGITGFALVAAGHFLLRDRSSSSASAEASADRAFAEASGLGASFAETSGRGAPRPVDEAFSLLGLARGMCRSLGAVFRVPSFCIIVLASMAVAVSNWNFLNWLPLYFKETFGVSLAEAGFAGTFLHQGGSVAAGLLGGMFSDRLAGAKTWRRFAIQAVCCTTAAPFLWIFFSPRPALVPFYFCVFTFSFLLSFGTSNVTPITCALLPPRLRSTAIGFCNATNCMAGGVGVMAAGFLKSRTGLGSVFGGISGMILLSAALMAFGSRAFLKRDLARRAKAKAFSGLVAESPVVEADG